MSSLFPSSGMVRLRLALLAGLLLGTYAGIVLSALTGSPWPFLLFVVLAHLLDLLVEDVPALQSVLRRSQFGISNRGLIRELAFVLLAARVDWKTHLTFYAVATFALALPVVRTTYLAVLVLLQRRLDAVVQVRNIDLSGLALPQPPPAVLRHRPGRQLHQLGLVPLLAGSVAAHTEQPLPYAIMMSVVVALLLVGLGFLIRTLAQFRNVVKGDELLAAVAERVRDLRAEVIVYFSGSADSIYQINMWLGTIDALSRRALIVLRERRNLLLLAPTATPVVCIPGHLDFMTFPLPDARVALYPTNVGKNLHMLRMPGIKHVFIGHGDSDKTASFNPFSKVYSEIWVAGEAGRDRYIRAKIGVSPTDIVEVGRPQLDAIAPAGAMPMGPLLTVLYAPTWEGWTEDPFHTSLMLAGPRLIERLLAARPRVRVIYKPHPLTGSVSSTAAETHARLCARLAADNTARARDPRLARLGGTDGVRSEQRLPPMLPAGGAETTPAQQAEAYRTWSERWWPAEPAWSHRIVTGTAPTLYDCFNASDLLVADISSVVSDFLASQKPYVVTNMEGLPADVFRETYPSAAAAYLLDQGAAVIPEILGLVTGQDPMAASRAAQKTYLLGPDSPPAMVRFDRAVDRAVRSAQETWPVRPMVDANA